MRKGKVLRLTEAEYLANEETSELRHEFVDGHVFAMTGATEAHGLICMNLSAFLHARLKGKSSRATANDMKVKIEATRSFYYPDIVANCAKFKADSVVATEPVFIVEVLSESTAAIDRREKLIAYQKLPTLAEYMIVHQDQQKVELYRRESENEWSHLVATAGDVEVILQSLPGGPTVLPLATIYEGYIPPGRVKEEEREYSY